MKKAVSFFLAFIIVSAFIAGIVYLSGYIFRNSFLSDPSNAVSIGLAGGLGGLLGPVIAAYISKFFSPKQS